MTPAEIEQFTKSLNDDFRNADGLIKQAVGQLNTGLYKPESVEACLTGALKRLEWASETLRAMRVLVALPSRDGEGVSSKSLSGHEEDKHPTS